MVGGAGIVWWEELVYCGGRSWYIVVGGAELVYYSGRSWYIVVGGRRKDGAYLSQPHLYPEWWAWTG